eukprot:s31_g3.t1
MAHKSELNGPVELQPAQHSLLVGTRPKPPPPPQPQVKHLPPPLPQGEISPRSPGPPLPPPPPAVERKEMQAPEPASIESDPPSSDESNSRPPSPPRVPLVEAG